MRSVVPMLAVASLALSSISCLVSPGVNAWTKGIEAERVTSVNLFSGDVFLETSNDLAQPIAIPAGSKAVITHYTADRVDMRVHRLAYTMYPQDGNFDTTDAGINAFIDKYFQAAKDGGTTALAPGEQGPRNAARPIGPDELDPSVRGGEAVIGMTKEQVYRSLGPPRYIEDTELTTLHVSRDRIFASDRWVYTESLVANLLPQRRAYVFERDRLSAIR